MIQYIVHLRRKFLKNQKKKMYQQVFELKLSNYTFISWHKSNVKSKNAYHKK